MARKKSNGSALVAAAASQQENGFDVPEGFEVRDFGIPLKRDGDVLQGVYEGPGKAKEMRKGKKIQKVGTYIVNKGGAKIEVLASSQLEQFFATCEEGDEVWIKRVGQIEGGKGRVNQYLTAVRHAQ